MKIGIVGSGALGTALARLFIANGHVVAVANTRGPNSLPELRSELGERLRAGTVTEVAIGGDLTVLAIPFGRHRELPVEPFRRKVVVDATNHRPERDGPLLPGQAVSSEVLAEHLAGARIVRAFNTIRAAELTAAAKPEAPGDDRLQLPVAGNDAAAKALVVGLIEQIGFAAIDAGPLGT